MTRVVIIGGGFAGVKCARTLRKGLSPDGCEIVLIARENSMVFHPLLGRDGRGNDRSGCRYRAAAADVARGTLPHRRSSANRFGVIRGGVRGYDGRLRRTKFDHAVMACCAAVNLALVPGMAEHAFR